MTALPPADPPADRLYALLPAAVRVRDELAGAPLRDLLRVIAEQVAVVEHDLDGIYENWFVETAQDWVLPYIGDLLGYQPASAAGELADAAPAQVRVLVPRREVAGLIAAHRRKGTLAVLEELVAEVAGWPARAVEFARLLAVFTNVNHVHPDRGRMLDLRDVEALDRLGGPFEQAAHVVDVRRVGATPSPGRYNIPEVGVFVWRLGTYPVTSTPAACIEEVSPSSFTFSVLGNDAPLFALAEAEPDTSTIAGERNLPVPIRRRALAADLAAYYGPGRSFAIEEGLRGQGGSVRRRPVAADRLVVADLTDWAYRPRQGAVAVDPVLGRLAFPPGRPPYRVWVDYRYGFSADIGAGEYPRRRPQPAEGTFYQAVRKHVGPPSRRPADEVDSLDAALARWEAVRAEQPTAVIEILDSEVYSVEHLDITLHGGELLEIRAADRTRPVIHLLDRLRNAADALTIRSEQPGGDTPEESYPDDDGGGDSGYDADDGEPAPVPRPGGCVRLDGLLIAGRAVHVEGPLQRVELIGCTLVPGWEPHADCRPRRASEPSLEIYLTEALVRVERCILGSIEVHQDAENCQGPAMADPVRIELCDSIVDATSDEREAIGAPNWPLAHASVQLRNCTVIGTVGAYSITRAENSIFTGVVRVRRRQLGCVRYSSVPPGSRTPHRFRCQPELAVAQGIAADAVRVRPTFESRRFGRPGYARLRLDCAAEIVRGANDESEMGAFHDLFQPQRLANIQVRLAEFSPARTDVAALPES